MLPAPEWCFQRLSRLLRRQRSVFEYFSGAGKVLYDTSPAPEKPEKYLKTLFRRRKSIYTHSSGAGEVLIYIHLFGAWEAGEVGEVFIYTQFLSYLKINMRCSYISRSCAVSLAVSVLSSKAIGY